MKIIVLGSFSPASRIGGVTVHCDRLVERLAESSHLGGCVNIAPSRLGFRQLIKGAWAIAKWSTVKQAILHFHTSYDNYPFLAVSPLLYVARSRSIISYHSGALVERLLQSRLDRWLFYYGANIAHCIVLMNNSQCDKLRKAFPSIRQKFVTAHSFVAPRINAQLIAMHREGRGSIYTVGCIGAWLRHYRLEDPIYAVRALAQRNPDVIYNINFAVSTSGMDEVYKDEVCNLAQESAGGNVAINFVEDVRDQFVYFSKLDVFVRPSAIDSFGLCVAESVLMRRHTIATSVCRRVNGVRLYTPGDLVSLSCHLSDVWDDINAGIICGEGLDEREDSFSSVMRIYKSYCTNHPRLEL